jgi:hypothetical protein
MKKLLLPLSLGLLVAASASAQITLTQASFTSASTSGADTLYNTATNPTYPALTADAGGNLDFKNATSNNNSSLLYRVAGTAGSQWADSTTLSFSGFAYKAKLESSLSVTGYVENGEHIDRVAYSLQGAMIPGTIAADSIVIKNQDIAFSAPRTRLAFPSTLNTKWASTYNFDFNFGLTFTALGYSNAAGIVRAFVTEKDTVIGYGKASVRTSNGNGSAFIDVLQVESVTSTVDSFYINGTPASSLLLSGFHASQGQTIITKEQNYFRAGELTPLVHITYDPTNTTPATSQTQAARLPVSIMETELTRTINVYPNPVTSHTVFVSGAPANFGGWNYELQNINGQSMTKGAIQLNANQNKAGINLPGAIAPGTYFLHLYNNAAQETVRVLTIK